MPHPPSFYHSLVLANPSPQSYLMYISSLLPTSTPYQIRSHFARAIASLSTIKDKDNMWIMWLNIELILGEFMQIVKKAIQSGVGMTVHFRIIEILLEQEKWVIALEFSKKMLKKFNKQPKAYIHFVKTSMAYANVKNLPSRLTPQEIIRRAHQALPLNEAITIEEQYGKLLYEAKQNQKARNVFENLINKYPKRIDLWTVYSDLEVKHGEVDRARNLFQRVLALGLKKKKLISILKKYHQLEEKHGAPQSAEAILQRAKDIAQKFATKDNIDSDESD